MYLQFVFTMPIVKVPVVQKFGIISHSYHMKLRRQMMEQNAPPSAKKNLWRSQLLISAIVKLYFFYGSGVASYR